MDFPLSLDVDLIILLASQLDKCKAKLNQLSILFREDQMARERDVGGSAGLLNRYELSDISDLPLSEKGKSLVVLDKICSIAHSSFQHECSAFSCTVFI